MDTTSIAAAFLTAFTLFMLMVSRRTWRRFVIAAVRLIGLIPPVTHPIF